MSVEPSPQGLVWEGGWRIDIAALQQAWDEAAAAGRRIRAILIVSPNNPTGSFLKKDERAALVELARAHDLALIADEVFSDYAFGPDETRVATLVGEREVLAFSLSGLSKVLGLPQLKLGWIHVGGPEAERAAVLGRLELVADTYLSLGAPVQLVPAIHSDEAWALLLLDEEGVLVQPGYFYDFAREAYLVVSLLPEPALFGEGVRRIVARAH